MIKETIMYECTRCQSLDIVKNGHTQQSKQKCHGHTCGASGTLNPTVKYPPEWLGKDNPNLSRRVESERVGKNLWCVSTNSGHLAEAKSRRPPPPWNTYWLRVSQMIYSSWMNCGPLSGRKKQAVGMDTFVSISLETEVRRVAGDYGTGYPEHMVIVRHTVISGKPTKWCLALWGKDINRWERKVEWRLM